MATKHYIEANNFQYFTKYINIKAFLSKLANFLCNITKICHLNLQRGAIRNRLSNTIFQHQMV